MVVRCHKMFENQPVTQSSWQMKKKPIWPPVVWNVCSAGYKYWILSILMQFHGYLLQIMRFVWLFLTFDKPLGLYLVPFLGFVLGCQFLSWIHFLAGEGCSKLAVVPLLGVLSSWHFVWRFPRCPSMKLCRLFWLAVSVVVCRSFESQGYECKNWQKFGPLRWN